MIRVLVVDDDFMVARIHARFVGQVDGFEVIATAGNGAEAIAAVEREEPDLLLLDVHLPDMDGIEVLRRLRSNGHATGVIVITAAREADTVRGALHGGASSYLTKPFELGDLAAHLQRFQRAHSRLSTGPAGQEDIDVVFGTTTPQTVTPMPKGLSKETSDAVRTAMRATDDLSAAECAERVGISRVSARRYLEHFVATGDAQVHLRYGTTGRPERRYRRGPCWRDV